jgi:putative ABC transport system permease protein
MKRSKHASEMHDPGAVPPPNARAAAMWRRYLHFWGPRTDADVDEELAFHLDMRVDDYLACGMGEAEARGAVAQRLGNLAAIRAQCIDIDNRRNRRMARTQLFDAFVQDIRFGVRAMWRQRGWTIVGVLTLALGIGANTAVFSVVNSLLLHPLAFPNADRLAVVFLQPTAGSVSGVSVFVTPTTQTLRAWQAGTHDFEHLEGFATSDMILRAGDGPAAIVHGATVQPSFAAFTGMRPLVGRYFADADVEGKSPVAVLSEGYWRSRYGADRQVAGTAIALDGKDYTVIGVMPAAFQLPAILQAHTDVFIPLDIHDDNQGVTMIGRLRPGVDYGHAARELDTLSAHQPGAPPKLHFAAAVKPPTALVGFHDSLLLLAGAVALVLIIACANVAHLLLARGATRHREMAIRAAVGAGRGRLFRQLITETLVLAGTGGVLGLGIGWAGLRALVALRPASLSELSMAHMDGTTVLVAAGLAVATGIVFGLVGASQSARLASPDVLRVGAPTSMGRAHDRVRSLLVVTEMALSTTLLVGAVLLIRSFAMLQFTDPGFRVQGLYSVSANLSATADTGHIRQWAYYDRLAERVGAIPGVQGVTLATAAPPGRNFSLGNLQVDDQPAPHEGSSFVAVLGVRPEYFGLMGIALVQGTTFTDTTAAAAQVIVNEGMARKFWPGGSAVGHRLRVENGGRGTWMTIVGVAKDASTGGVMMATADPMLYQSPSRYHSPTLLLRTRDPAVALPAIRRLASAMNASIPPVQVNNIVDTMAASIARPRFTMLLLAIFTGLALVLAAVGLYGVMAYAVAQRTREIGIRVALGATAGHIARRVVGRGLLLAMLGMGAGLVGAHWGTRVLSNMLSGVSPNDPWSYGAAALALLVTAVAACVVPTRRAARVDPMVAMRSE